MQIEPTVESPVNDDPAPSERPRDDDTMRDLVTRLARPHRSGGRAIERASLLSAGADFDAAVAWIKAHGGEAESSVSTAPQRGLHSPQQDTRGSQPQRFVLPAGALG